MARPGPRVVAPLPLPRAHGGGRELRGDQASPAMIAGDVEENSSQEPLVASYRPALYLPAENETAQYYLSFTNVSQNTDEKIPEVKVFI